MSQITVSEFPVKLTWEITERCNLDCKICYSNNNISNDLKEYSFQECLAVINKLVELGVIYIFLDGGEPLLYKHFFSLLNECTSKFSTMLSTNGTLIGQDEAKRISTSKIKTVFVSLHGCDSSMHDSYTQTPGSFNATINGIKYLIDYGVDTMVSIVLHRENYLSMKEYILLCKDLKISKINILRGYPIGRNCDIGKKLRLKSNNYMDIIPYIEKICEQESVKLGHSFGSRNHNCCAQAISLSAEGLLRNCPYLRNQGNLGVFLNNDPNELWNSETSKLIRSSFDTKDSYCSICTEHSKCREGCPADKLLDYNFPIGKDPLCWL